MTTSMGAAHTVGTRTGSADRRRQITVVVAAVLCVVCLGAAWNSDRGARSR